MAVGKLSWKCASLKCALAQHQVACLARRFATARRIQRLANHLFPVARILFKELQHASVHRSLHNPLHLGCAELRLRLSFELRINKLDGDNSGETFAHIFTGEVRIVVFDRAILAAPIVQRTGECGAEAGDVCSAVNGVDVVCKCEQRFRPRVALILECNLNTCCPINALQIDWAIMCHLTLAIQVTNE